MEAGGADPWMYLSRSTHAGRHGASTHPILWPLSHLGWRYPRPAPMARDACCLPASTLISAGEEDLSRSRSGRGWAGAGNLKSSAFELRSGSKDSVMPMRCLNLCLALCLVLSGALAAKDVAESKLTVKLVETIQKVRASQGERACCL
jgi:hypothetical protein